MTRDITIGITGGIGSGKSVVSRVLRCNGFKVFDCDYEAKVIMNKEPTKLSLIAAFGEEIYTPDGNLNRPLMSEIIFNDKEKLRFVNSIVHQEVKNFIRMERKKTRGYFFIESAILSGSGITDFCDEVWLVVAPERLRLKRAMERDGVTQEKIETRMKAQSKELSQLSQEKVTVLRNDEFHAILPEILKKTKIYQQNQKYTLSC
ncbi:MAG: dephospho-CoA kinase [Muribaculaceae bacterium]|nr:dephospho-CoA kinase [Muribaculaceae bacterium]